MKKVKEIRELTGLSRPAFSDKYKIPVRTLENWEQERRDPPEYVLYLLEKVVKNDCEKTYFKK